MAVETVAGPVLGDAFGQALQACWAAGARPGVAYEIVEREDGYIGVTDAAEYLNPPQEWSPLEQRACEAATGRVLDVGCGGGRHAAVLAARGVAVTGLEPSPGAAAIARERGIPVVDGSIESPPPELAGYGAILLLGNNLGLLGGAQAAPRVLANLARLAAPDGVVLATGIDPYAMADPVQRDYHDRNRRRGRLPGQMRIRARHANLATGWFDYLFASPEELRELVSGSPWRLSSVDRWGPGYLATLIRG